MSTMAYSNKCAKIWQILSNLCKQTVPVEIIVETVVTSFWNSLCVGYIAWWQPRNLAIANRSRISCSNNSRL